jgi:hypothetical protein
LFNTVLKTSITTVVRTRPRDWESVESCLCISSEVFSDNIVIVIVKTVSTFITNVSKKFSLSLTSVICISSKLKVSISLLAYSFKIVLTSKSNRLYKRLSLNWVFFIYITLFLLDIQMWNILIELYLTR